MTAETPDELCAIVHREQGFLVMAAFERFSVGEIMHDTPDGVNPGASFPFRITGESTRAAYEKQAELMREYLPPGCIEQTEWRTAIAFYTVEVAD